MRNISLDILRVTEAAAIAASRWIGSGNKIMADKAATEAIRRRLNNIHFAAKVVMGEGEKDKSYGLFPGECVGKYGVPHCGKNPSAGSVGEYLENTKSKITLYDLAIDPIEGTRPTVTSGPEAISCLAVANENCMFSSQKFYMLKIAYGHHIKKKVTLSLNDPIERTIDLISKSTGKPLSRIMVCILNRPRHHDIIQRLRNIGTLIKLIQDCDVSGSIATCREDSGIDLMYGVGGSPEAVLSAAAIKCLGGDFQSKEVKLDEDGVNWSSNDRILHLEDLVKGPCIFVATGITDGSILHGVRSKNNRLLTNSVFMRSESGTVRWIETEHGN